MDKTVIGRRAPDLADAFSNRIPILIVLRGRQLGRRYLLNEQSLLLGRNGERAAIVIEGDPQISGVHARIFKDPSAVSYFVQDMESLNGTLLNGHPIRESKLEDGDKIVLGQTILKFTFQDAVEEDFMGQVDQLMNVDDLTGLPVLRVFQDRVHQKLTEAQSAGRALSVMMMDMDGLKKINDTHGHQFGAYIIAEVGRLIGEAVAAGGEASRFGGDEFVAYLYGEDKQHAVAVSEGLRKKLLDTEFQLQGIRLHPSISIGVASHPGDGNSVEILIRKADEALYRAKRGGRNCVAV